MSTRLVAKKDAQGRVIGFEAVDENGVVVGGATQGGGQPEAPVTLPGQPLPEIRGDFRSTAQRQAGSGGSGGDDSEGGYTVPQSVLNEMQGQNPGQPQAAAERPQMGPEAPTGMYEDYDGNIQGGNAISRFFRGNAEASQDYTDRQIAAGGIQGFLGRSQRFQDNVVAGIFKGVDDIADFGAAVIDTVRGQEVNDDDNFVNLSGIETDARNTGERVVRNLAGFGVTFAAGTGVASKIPAIARLAQGGAGARLAYSATVGAAADFVTAKKGEENLSSLIQNTPLANPVTKLLAADTSEDASYWGEKVKATTEGLILGSVFDILGETVKAARVAAGAEPLSKLANGIRKAKGLDPDAEKAALLALDKELQQSVEGTQKLLAAAVDKEVGQRITDARRLLKAADDTKRVRSIDDLANPPISPLDVNNIPRLPNQPIEAPGEIGVETAATRLALLEEEAIKLSDLRRGLYDEGIDADFTELDKILFEVSDEIDAYTRAAAGDTVVVPGAFEPSPERIDLNQRLDGPRITREEALGDARPQVDRELAEVNQKYSEVSNQLREIEEAGGEVDEALQAQLADLTTQREDLLNAKADYEGELGAFDAEADAFIPTPTREPQTPPNAAGQVEGIRPNDGPGALPDRQPQLQSGAGVGRREAVGDPTARNYRTKPEIRRDVANKEVAERVAQANPDVTPAASEGAPVRPRKPLRAIDLSKKEFTSRLKATQNGESVGRFVNLDKLTDSDEVAATVKDIMESIDESKIVGKLSDGQLQRRASNLVNRLRFLSPKDADAVMDAYAGIASNGPTAQLAIRMMAEDMGTQLNEAASVLAKNKGLTKLSIADMKGDADLAFKLSRFENFLTFNKNLGAIQGQSLRARGLSSAPTAVKERLAKADYESAFKQATEATENIEKFREDLLGLLQTPQGRKRFDGIKADLSNADSLEEVAAVTKAAKFASNMNKVNQLVQGVRMNAILSGTRSNLTNVLSNAVMAAYVPATQIAGAVIDAPIQILRGNTAAAAADKEAIQHGLAMYSGLVQYIGDSAKMAKKAFKQGSGILGEDQVLKEADQIKLLQAFGEGDGHLDIPKVLGHTLSMPSRLLVTGDEFFKQLNYRAFVRANSLEEGLKKGLTGKKLKDYAEDMVQKSFSVDEVTGIPGLALDPKGKEYAEFVTFQSAINSKTSTGRNAALQIVETLRNTPVLNTLTPLFVPFIKTPLNIMAYTGRNSPLAVTSKSWRAAYQAGGRQKAQALGELALGTTALMSITGLAMQGKLTGRAPKDRGEREQWFAAGYQPYSIRVGNKWVSFQRMEPFAGHFGIVADMVNATSRSAKEDGAELEEVQGNVLLSFVAAVRNRTFFQGISDLVDTIEAIGSDDARDSNKISTVTENIAATLLPYGSLLNEQRRARDQTLREAEGLVEKVINKIPGMSESLPAQRNWLTGQPVLYGNNPVMNLYPSSQMKDDPLIKNLLRYNVPLNPPDKKIKGGVEISNEQYSRLLQLTGTIEIDGKTQYQALTEAFNSFDKSALDAELDYIRANDEYARQTPLSVEIAAVRSRYAKAAESALVQVYPELVEQVRTSLNESGNVKEGMFWLNSSLYSDLGYEVADDPAFAEKVGRVNQRTDRGLETLVEGPGPASVAPVLPQ